MQHAIQPSDPFDILNQREQQHAPAAVAASASGDGEGGAGGDRVLSSGSVCSVESNASSFVEA
jgi:hypothetical protein